MVANKFFFRVKRKLSSGFTLVEVLIALAIVAIALPAMVMLVISQVDGAGHVRDKTYAMWVAENEMTRLNLLNNKQLFPDVKLPEKDSRRVENQGISWQVKIETGKDEDHPDLPPGVILLKVSVNLLGPTEGAQKETKEDPLATLIEYTQE